MTTDRVSPVALTAPVAAVAVVLATGWATTQAGADVDSGAPDETAEAPVARSSASVRPDQAEARVLRKAIHAERQEVRHLERALERARARLAAEQRTSALSASAPVASSGGITTTTSGNTGSSGSGSSGSGSGGGSGSSGSSNAGQPATNTTTSGS